MIVTKTKNANSYGPCGGTPWHYIAEGINRGKTLCNKPITEHWEFKEVYRLDDSQVCRNCQRRREIL